MTKFCSNCGRPLSNENSKFCPDCTKQQKDNSAFRKLWLPDLVTIVFFVLSGLLLLEYDNNEAPKSLFLWYMSPFYFTVIVWNFISNILVFVKKTKKKTLLQYLDEKNYKRLNGQTPKKWWTGIVLIMGILFCVVVIMFAIHDTCSYLFSMFSVFTYVSYMFGEYNLYDKIYTKLHKNIQSNS